MSKADLSGLSAGQLLARFVQHCLAQDDALYGGPVDVYNRHFRAMMEIVAELKVRPADLRSELLSLYSHENPQVRLQAANASYAIAPAAARDAIEAIANSKQYPYAGHAGMALWAIDKGISSPA